MKQKHDIIVIGGGHAGIETALIGSKLGCSILIITQDINAIGRMSCNPAIGGLAKGQIVREIDVLGGKMGMFADFSGIQFKTLNKSKGRSVWSPRAQVDKRVYEKIAKKNIITNQNIYTYSNEATNVSPLKSNSFLVETRDGIKFTSKTVVVTCGTFLSGKIHIGDRKILAGRMGEERADGITESLQKLGLRSGKLKTGTPPRLISKSINWKETSIESGDTNPIPFSYQTKDFNPPNIPCFTIKTNNNTHDLINKKINLSPMFSGDIQGIGPRYCPSIEDKVHRFTNHESHLLHLEPEWKNSDQIYLNGFSTSLPESTQLDALRTIKALKDVEFFRPGYAIEYDFFPPEQLKATLESKIIKGLFFAGQINGTSGYEEAAAQGLIAGINAASKVLNKKELVLPRSKSYIGVMIDDLITKDTAEPYRMFTSRAEYRILLRFSNTNSRLFNISEEHSLINTKEANYFKEVELLKKEFRNNLKNSITPKETKEYFNIKQKMPADQVLKRPEFKIENLPSRFLKTHPTKIESWLHKETLKDVETEIKYGGYIKRHLKEIVKLKSSEELKLPNDTNYSKVKGLSAEAVEKLNTIKPETLGQAKRISGIKPSDVSVLMVGFFRK